MKWIIIGMIAAVTAVIGVTVYQNWSSEEPEAVVQKPEPASITKKADDKRDIETSNSTTIIYTILENNKNAILYKDVTEAIKAIDTDDKTLRISFALKPILEKTSLNNFKLFISRLGDYIFATRLIDLEDTAKMVGDYENARALPENIADHGNMLFENGDVASVTIRGLGKNTHEIKKVADNFIRGLNHPEDIAIFSQLRITPPSQALLQFMMGSLDEKSLSFTPEIRQFLDQYLNAVTADDQNRFKTTNLAAFMPLDNFCTALGLGEGHLIKQCNDKFFGAIRDNLLPAIGKNTKLTDEGYYERLIEPTHKVLMALGDWVEESNIRALLLSSLFRI